MTFRAEVTALNIC